MRAKRSSIVKALLCLSGTAAMIGALATTAVRAQTFEYQYGGSCDEAGRMGVQPVSAANGRGYIAAGDSKSNTVGCQGSDIYVVKTNDNGIVAWANTYDIGGANDSATCVRECTLNGGVIVTGVTTPNNQICGFSRSAFLLKLDKFGTVQWVRTYGSTAFDELATNVLEMTTGNSTFGTLAGDYVFCGMGWVAGGDRDAYMVRTDNSGNVRWGKLYSGNVGYGDAFMGMCESHWASANGSIVAVGVTNYDEVASTCLFLATRINGNTGGVISGAQWGGSHMNYLYSVDEMPATIPYSNNLVVTGFTNSPSTPFGINAEIYVAQLGTGISTGGFWQATYGDGSLTNEVGSGICVNRGSRPNNLVLTGYVELGAIGGQDAFLMELQPFTLNRDATGVDFKCYGSLNNDQGYSLAQVASDPGFRTAGFVVSGFTEGYAPTDPRQLYLIKTDDFGVTDCHYTTEIIKNVPTFERSEWSPTITNRLASCQPSAVKTTLTQNDVICYNPFGKAVGGEDRKSAADQSAVAGALVSFPNPVTGGNSFTLECTLAKDADVTVSVADMAGRTVYIETRKESAGDLRLPVSTEGWSGGVYVVKVAAGGDVMMKKIVVSEK